MSTQSHTEMIRNWYELLARGDIGRMLELLTDDVTGGYPEVPGLAYTGIKEGKAGITSLFMTLQNTIEAPRITQKQLLAADDRVVAIIDFRSQVKGTGKIYELEELHAFTFREGKISAFRFYQDSGQMLAAFKREA